ncbi:MAG: FHA domain-containing protein [Planctomycetota bacterium]
MATTSLLAGKFKEGTRLRYAIYGENDALLLNAGTMLTPNLIALLARRGIRLRLNASLEVLEGAQARLEIPVPDSCTLTIGRNPNCLIRPTSRLVSGYHCVFVQLPLTLVVEDQNSTNGTFVNGTRIDDLKDLNDGDFVQIGDLKLRVRLYACLEGVHESLAEVSGLILAGSCNDVGPTSEPERGSTVTLEGSSAEAMRSAIDAAWQKKNADSPEHRGP